MADESTYLRPTTVADLASRFDRLISDHGARVAREFRPAPSDVFIATPPKCGTTWMQQIVHGLRTGGSRDFRNINDVIPWFEMAFDVGQDLDADQGAIPRAFKTHWTIDEVPAGARYIAVVRNPRDALLSTFAFFEGAFFERGAIDLETFAGDFYVPAAEVPRHVLAIWRRRHDPALLPTTYEHMSSNLAATVRRVAKFIGVNADPNLCDLVVQQSSQVEMNRYRDKFDDSVFFESFRHSMALPATGSLAKVRAPGATREVPARVVAQLDEMWSTLVAPQTGWRDYDAFVDDIARWDDPIST